MIKSKSVRYIFIVIALLTGMMTFYNFYYIYPSFKTMLVKNTEDEAIRLAKHLKSMYFKDNMLESIGSSENFHYKIEALLSDFHLLKLKVFSSDGVTLYSTDMTEVGTINERSYFHDIVANGGTYSKVVKKDTQSLEDKKVSVDVVEAYVPVMSDGKFIGAFEIYYDITEKSTELQHVMHITSYITVLMLIAGISITTLMMIKLDRSIHAQRKVEAELKIYAEKLHKSNLELESFAHIASHDLQEPLRKVIAFGDRVINKYSEVLGEQGRDYLERMQRASSRMQHLIDGLLMYSRVSTKAQPFVPVDISSIINEVLSDLEVRIHESNGKIEVESLPTVNGDPLQMRQLFQNLIGNALKFTKEGEPPVVKISAFAVHDNGMEDKKGLYQFTLTDNGIGFDEQYAERIFGVFQRLHGRSAYEGSGIGLSVCKKIVERHGGTIKAKSVPGQGATFIFNLPAGNPENAQTAELNAEEEPSAC